MNPQPPAVPRRSCGRFDRQAARHSQTAPRADNGARCAGRIDPDRCTGYLYASNRNNAEFALYGLPISYLMDRQGRVRGYIAGAVDWDSAPARDLIRYYTGGPAAPAAQQP